MTLGDNQAPNEMKEAWRTSRAGARSGAGYRYQDAVGVFLALRSWCGEIAAERLTPESLDDFALEAAGATFWVQAKSKIAPDASFTPGEIARVILGGPGLDDDERWIVLDRPFAGIKEEARPIATEMPAALLDRLKTNLTDYETVRLESRIARTRLLILPNPIDCSIDEIAAARGIARLAARACVSELVHHVGEAASQNANTEYAERRCITSSAIQALCDEVLTAFDPRAVDEVIHTGIAVMLTFDTPNNDPEFFRGVSATPGHIAAGLVIPRPDDTKAIAASLADGRDVLICGPSGAGKSALGYLAALETSASIRWIEIKNFDAGSRGAALAFLKGLAPSPARPVGVYVDDVGRGGEGAWAWLRSQARSIPGLRCLGSVREEDLSIVTGRYDVSVYRPHLSEEMAAAIFAALKARFQCKPAHWREAFEASSGLMLEFIHMLTQGRRLRDLVEEQIERRLSEGRDVELQILPLAAAAGRCGAAIEIDTLKTRLSLGDADFARAYDRLRKEHLVGERDAGLLHGLHEIRSQTIYDVCLDKLALRGCDVCEGAAMLVRPGNMRRYLTVLGREGDFDNNEAIKALAERLTAQPSFELSVEGLEALRLRTIARDAESFHAIAKDLKISHRHYMLCMLVMHGDLAKGFKGTPVFDHLRTFRERFERRRASDLRLELLAALPDSAIDPLIEACSSPEETVRLVSALHGAPLQALASNLKAMLHERMQDADIALIAEYLAVLFESDLNAAKAAAVRFGGSQALLDRLWRQTPWALKPIFERSADGAFAVTANLLSIEDAEGDAEKTVNKHASAALQLSPEAEFISARPLPISGEAISINGYTPGVERLRRDVVTSQAAVSWNRMIIHAVAQRFGAQSRTEILARYRLEVEQAARQVMRAVDFVCRGRRFTSKHREEAISLQRLEELLPIYPLAAPEDQLPNSLDADITDPIGAFVVDLSEFLTALIDEKKTGHQLASFAEDILKSMPTVRGYADWEYVDGAPLDALSQIEEFVGAFRPLLLAVSHRRLHDAGDVFSVRREWPQGTGLSRLTRRVQIHWERKRDELARHVRKTLDAEIYARPSRRIDSVFWPDWDLCIIKPAASLVEYFIWLESATEALRQLAATADRCVVAPLIGNVVPEQLAVQIYPSTPSLPDPGFRECWCGAVGSLDVRSSPTCTLYERAINAMVNLYSVQRQLGEKPLSPGEEAKLQEWADEGGKAIRELSAKSDEGDECAAFAYLQLAKLNDEFTVENDGVNAVKFALSMQRDLLSSDVGDETAHQVMVKLTIIADELNLPLGDDVLDTTEAV